MNLALAVLLTFQITDCYTQEDEYYLEDFKREKRSVLSFYKSGQEMAQKTTLTLDDLLGSGRYNKRVRPDFGSKPVKVTLNLSIRSMVRSCFNQFSLVQLLVYVAGKRS